MRLKSLKKKKISPSVVDYHQAFACAKQLFTLNHEKWRGAVRESL